MKMKGLRTSLIITFLAVLGAVLAQPVEASHFRYGHIHWQEVPDMDNTVDVFVTIAARRSFYRGSGSDWRPVIGDIIRMGAIRFGDGSVVNPYYEVVAIHPEEDWLIGRAMDPQADDHRLRKTYSDANNNGSPWQIRFDVCCRLHATRNAGSSLRITSYVDLAESSSSPVSNISPLVSCARGERCEFDIPATLRSDKTLRWVHAPTPDTNISTSSRPGSRWSQHQYELQSDTGRFAWQSDPDTPLGLYAVPVQIQELDAAGNVVSAVPIEFLIHLRDFATNQPPAFDIPPTPASNEVIEIAAGREAEILVQASDPDSEDTVVIRHVGLPDGAELEMGDPANPGQAVFRWTPDETQLGDHIVTLSATDNHNQSALPHVLRLRVIDPAISDVRVINRFPGEDLELDPASFSRAPDKIREVDGYTEIEWFFDSFSVDETEHLDWELVLHDLVGGERRLVSESTRLSYRDMNGDLIRRDIGPRHVDVLRSIFSIDTATDRSTYPVGDTVRITTQVGNLGEFEEQARVGLAVHDQDGVPVTDLGVFDPAMLAPGEDIVLEGRDFDSSGIFVGSYEVRASLLSTSGDVIDDDHAAFLLVDDGSPLLAASLVTDAPSYGPNDPVLLDESVSNSAEGRIFAGGHAVLEVFDPAGDAFWSRERSLGALGPGQGSDFGREMPLNGAEPGEYAARLTAYDEGGVAVAMAETDFRVRSSAETGEGLRAAISVVPAPVPRSDEVMLSVTVGNAGNAEIAARDLRLRLADPATETVLGEWTLPMDDLAVGEEQSYQRVWRSLIGAPAMLMTTLHAEFDGEQRLFASDAVPVDAKFDGGFALGERGRVLILVDPEPAGQAGGANNQAPGHEPRVTFLRALLDAAGWSYTIVDNARDFADEFRTGAYRVYLLDAADEHLAVQVQRELREAIYRGDGLVFSGAHDSRNSHLWAPAGVSFHGKPTQAGGIVLMPSEVHPGGEDELAWQERVLRLSNDGAQVIGDFPGNGQPALATRDYGFGRVVTAAFDAVGQATTSGQDGLLAELILGALTHAHGDEERVLPGGTLPVQFDLGLDGEAAEGVLGFSTTPALDIVDPGVTEPTDDGGLERSFVLTPDEQLSLDYWLGLPLEIESIELHADIHRQIDGDAWYYGRFSHSIDVEPAPAVADVRLLLEQQTGQAWQQAADLVAKAERELDRGRHAQALKHLVNAASQLEQVIGAAQDDIRRDLALLIRLVARQVPAGPGGASTKDTE